MRIIGTALLAIVWAATASAGGLAPKRASDLVTLISDPSTPICPGTSVPHSFADRLLPDGTRVAFSIPSGQVLVITSYDWIVEGSSEANRTVWTGVGVFDVAMNQNRLALTSSAGADGTGRAAGSTTAPAGIAVTSGAAMCLDYVGGASAAYATLHGFLATDK
jgi:hypothetical protein